MKTSDQQTTTCESSQDLELEELVLRESIVSAIGLHSENVQFSIKGDPTLRDSVFTRGKQESQVDQLFPCLEPHLRDMILHRSVYRIYIGFNSGEIRTCSVFDPMREEIHQAEKLCEPNYIKRHFPEIDYTHKVEGIRDIYKNLRESTLFQYVPDYWKRITHKRAQTWNPIRKHDLPNIIHTLQKFRGLEELYLRNATICIIQHVVRLQFNCDGTQLIDAKNYCQFLEDNLER